MIGQSAREGRHWDTVWKGHRAWARPGGLRVCAPVSCIVVETLKNEAGDQDSFIR